MQMNEELRQQAEKVFDNLYKQSFFTDSDSTYNFKYKNQKTKATGARIPEEWYGILQEIAQKENVPVNYIICESISDTIISYRGYEHRQKEEKEAWLAEFDKMSADKQKKFLQEKKVEFFDRNIL